LRNRKSIERLLIITIILLVCSTAMVAGEQTAAINADAALQRLQDGNKRYVAATLIHPEQTPERRLEMTKGQHPFAIILACSDSRVPPEIIFDQGLGDLFVVRVAGNIAADVVIGSIEYAVEHLNVSLVIVLGHERCGAVTAAVNGDEHTGQINSLTDAIKPAVELARTQPGDLVDNAVKDNIQLVVKQLMTAKPILTKFIESGKLSIVGEYYDLDDGTVRILQDS